MKFEREPRPEAPPSLATLQRQETGVIRKLSQAGERLPPAVRSAALGLFALFRSMSAMAAEPTTPLHQHLEVVVAPDPATKSERLQHSYEQRRQQQLSDFMQLLSEFKADHASLEFLAGATIDPYGHYPVSTKQQEAALNGLMARMSTGDLQQVDFYTYVGNPLTYLETNFQFLLEIPAELKDHRPIKVVPYQIQVAKNPAGPGLVFQLMNWVKGEVTYTSPAFTPEQMADQVTFSEYCQPLRATIVEQIQRGQPELAAALAEKQQALGQSTQVREPSLRLGKEPVPTAKTFFQQFDTAKIILHAASRPVDSTNGLPLTISSAFLESTQQRALQFNGQVDIMYFEKRYHQGDSDFNRVKGRSAETYRDQHGNLVGVEYIVPNQNTVIEAIQVYPTTEFVDEPAPTEEFKPLVVDLEKIGYGRLDNYIIRPVERPIATVGDGVYRLYTSMDATALQEQSGQYFEALAQGAKQAEELFGVPPGSLVKRIMIADARHPNAQFSNRNLDTIQIWDDGLTSIAEVQRTAFHESIHLLDVAFKIDKGNVDLWDTFFAKLTKTGHLFAVVNEDVWYPELSDMGHGEQNPAELIASFMNTLVDPHWEQRIAQCQPEQVREYLEALTILEQALRQAAGSLNAQAPIFQLLKTRQAFIRTLG